MRRTFWLSCAVLLALISTAALTTLNTKVGATADLPAFVFNQQKQSNDSVWQMATTQRSRTAEASRIRAFRELQINRTALIAILGSAPLDSGDAAKANRVELTLPFPDGTFARFAIVESPIMEPELASRFPEIKTYRGQGLDEATATTRFDWTPQGFHAMVLSARGTILIEPAASGDTENYIVYSQGDVPVASSECDVSEREQELAIAKALTITPVRPAVTSGTTLRTYRLAVAATAEYTQTYGSGTVGGGLSAITTTINLVDAIYERDVAIRLVLVANETAIIFTNTATDGYTSDNPNAMLNENQTNIDSLIGSANYDIGHVFDGRLLGGGAFSWQGVAGIGSVCVTGFKARGVDIFRSVTPTSVFAYYSAAHEMGHQFGATHTFNATTGSCGSQRSPGSAYEPVNGTTIMAYRFACAPEDLMSTDTYFHNNSIEQIVNYSTTGGGNGCAVPTGTGNNPPLVNAGPSYTVPQSTPFALTAAGSDPDGDALTFTWEEFDLGASAPPDADDGSRPIFRSFAPTASPTRTFPSMSDILTGTTTLGESLPVTTRTMNFRATARDNRSGGGGVNSSATQVNVRADSGPVIVSQPVSGANWTTNSVQTATWSVANTQLAPVNCTSVKILLSIDSGLTFPIVLANATPNDGLENVTVPGGTSPFARVKVTGNGNIFFNISRGFSITGSNNTTPTISGFSPGTGTLGDTVTITGTNFISPSSVNFNGVAASFTVNSTTEIVATVPAGASTGPITVVTPSGTATSATNFTLVPPVNNIQFSAANYNAGEGNGSVTITVTRTGNTAGAARIDFASSDGTATQSQDYEVAGGTLSFAAGETSKTFDVLIVDDAFVESNETLNLTVANPTGATLGTPTAATVTINDNDSSGATSPIAKQFVANMTPAKIVPPVTSNGTGGGVVQLNQSETSGKVSLLFATLSGSELFASIRGPAGPNTNAPIIFSLPSGNPLIDSPVSTSTQQVADLKAGLHFMSVHTNPFPNGEIRGQLLWNPLEEADFFVRQQYLDFLSRGPDPGGFTFWSGTITQCNSAVQCLRDQRVVVSNAFFYEQEYQQTASYVQRLYRAAYGDNQPHPNPNTDPNFPNEEKKMPSYTTFVADRARVIGGASLAQSQLDLANAFVARPEFIAKYPASLSTAGQFVDAVLATIQNDIGVNLGAQRNNLINLYNSFGRGGVLYRLADDNAQTNPISNQAFIDAEYNRSFVLGQYFGYLRRDPDIGGFVFWLGQVSSGPLRDVPKQHAMVCSFTTSAEYQFRFGPVASRDNSECPR
jgi:hypothetical protein